MDFKNTYCTMLKSNVFNIPILRYIKPQLAISNNKNKQTWLLYLCLGSTKTFQAHTWWLKNVFESSFYVGKLMITFWHVCIHIDRTNFYCGVKYTTNHILLNCIVKRMPKRRQFVELSLPLYWKSKAFSIAIC